ncbi:MAG: NPCBM/NEW2 domain-containing protein [Ilumatobacteraceae bacterium]
MNVTVAAPTAAGYLTVWPKGVTQPNASNLNFEAGQTVPNLVISKIGSEGKISYYSSSGSVHVLIDVLGYISTQTPLTEALDQVLYSDATFDETTTPVQGTPRYNSLTWAYADGSKCRTDVTTWTEYNLGRQWKTLATTLAFDDAKALSTSKIRFRILGDGVELVNRTLTFGQTADVTANVTNVLRVRFEIINANATSSTCSSYPTFATPRLSR